ncbi:MAG TPA: sigma factor [Pyrinomonadaceae bacterium]|jgi:DNA-directed RNA polymerase specialized sigma24 family protein
MLEPSEIPRAPESKEASKEASHEELFLARYGPLRSWAQRLTGGDAARAEDLVHDAFVHFTLARPDLARMQNLDGYLYRMLRNLNTSHVRRAARRREDAPAVVEYDSAEFVLRAADPRDLIRVQDDLRQVCHYATLRKETSKAGSVLILRFMHGYYPGEIARFTRSTREAVEERLRVARSEAKQYLKDPESLRFISREKVRGAGARAAATGYAQTPEELLRDLRRRVFDSRRGECMDDERLAELYEGAAGNAPDCATLAHLVSCPVCIDEVNRLRNLPPLSERFPTDALGNEPRGGRGGGGGDEDGGGGGTGHASGEEEGRCRRRARDVFEHRPRELCVSVNGRVVAAQKVGSEVSEQKLNVSGDEAVSFVEVFSEQDVRLLYLDPAARAAEPDGGFSVSVGLSDRRVLEARLTYVDSAPTVQVVYRDPLLAARSSVREEAAEEAARRGGRFDESAAGEPHVEARRWPRWLRRLLGHIAAPFTSFRPGAVAAVLAVLVVAALLFTRLYAPAVSAAELLRRAATAEESAAAAGVVLHRTVYVEEARADGRGRTTRKRVETWQGGAAGSPRLRRLYDEQGRLSAGELTKADGTIAVYRRGLPPTSADAAGASDVASLIEAGDLWRVEPSASAFVALVGAGEGLKVEDKLGAYVVGVGREAQAGAVGGLQSASLWLNKADLHAYRMTLVVRRGGESFEYRFIEGGFERRRPAEVPPSVYQVEPELLGASQGRQGANANAQSEEEARQASVAPRATAVASAELEVEVAYLLNQIKANLGEQVSMGRTTGGALRVEALVESEGRKEAILRALGPVLGNPAVSVEVSTVAEEMARREREREGATIEREVVVGAGRIPADAELRAHLGARLADGGRVDAEIKQFAARAMGHSRQALLHASALKRLVGRFTPEEARALQPDARAKWLSMIREHAGACRREVAALRAQLAPVFGAHGGGGQAPGGESPAQSAERLLQSSYAQDDAVRAAFTLSEGGSAAAIRSAQFWRALASSERLAAAIQEAYDR